MHSTLPGYNAGYKIHFDVFLEPDIEGFDREIDQSGLEKMWIMKKKSVQDDASFFDDDEEALIEVDDDDETDKSINCLKEDIESIKATVTKWG